MIVYLVSWRATDELIQGRGKRGLHPTFCFTVLCQNIKDASECLHYYFRFVFQKDEKYKHLGLEDGETTIKRYKLDSRSFTIQYMLMDGMKKPLSLYDISRSILLY